MKLPEGVEWALHCAWTLALDGSADPLSTRRLAVLYDLPETYLAKLLTALVRASLLTATTGPRGGFRLARSPDTITVADVVIAIEGRSALFPCAEIRQRGPVPLTGSACRRPCGIARVMSRAERAWRAELSATTIADLVDASGVGAVERVKTWLNQLPGTSPSPEAASSSDTRPENP